MTAQDLRKFPRFITHGTIDNVHYFVVDAWVALGMNWMSDLGVPVQRIALSHGSSRYEMRIAKRTIGWIDTVALGATTTRIECTIAAGVPENVDEPFKALVTEFVAYFVRVFQQGEPVDVEAFLPLLSDTQIHNLVSIKVSIINQLPSSTASRSPTRAIREPPDKDAPIEDWLDWRESELRRGRGQQSVSYKRLSEMSNYTIDQFKDRKRTKKKP